MNMLPEHLRGLPALSIRQPWASLVALGFKTLENRDWSDRYPAKRFRGRFLIHASSGCTGPEWSATMLRVKEIDFEAWKAIASEYGIRGGYGLKQIPLGGIIGHAVAADIISSSDSPWFFGPDAIVVKDAKPLDFIPCKGALGYFRPQFPLPPESERLSLF